MNPFCRLKDPGSYVASPWDFSQDAAARVHFIAFFRQQYLQTMRLAVDQAVLEGNDRADARCRADECKVRFFGFLDQLAQDPAQFGRATILTIDHIRDGLPREAGFADPYLHQKRQQNAQALPFLASVCRDLDQLAGRSQLEAVIRGAMAGNIFDMGVAATAQRMLSSNLDFIHTRDSLPARPWRVDGLDALAQRVLEAPAHRKAIVLVDNAGSDFVLGMVPLCRYLAQRGTEVLIAGNELPTLNDMTCSDIRALWPDLASAEHSLGDLPIRVVSTGTGEPLIDLLAVSDELNGEAADADLVILEGMGRALESNFDAVLDCDTLKLAMIKEEYVAAWLGGKLYDVVCRFDPGSR
jgi:damage-control phosphatase, subfamily II, stand-alone protein